MKCREARKALTDVDGNMIPGPVREHLAHCSDCRSDATMLSDLAEGIKLLALDPIPEPSIGFRGRVLRQLEQQKRETYAPSQLLESAGRQVVFASLILVLFLLLAMAVPSSGPFRRKSAPATDWLPEEDTLTAVNYTNPLQSLAPVPILVNLRSADAGGL